MAAVLVGRKARGRHFWTAGVDGGPVVVTLSPACTQLVGQNAGFGQNHDRHLSQSGEAMDPAWLGRQATDPQHRSRAGSEWPSGGAFKHTDRELDAR